MKVGRRSLLTLGAAGLAGRAMAAQNEPGAAPAEPYVLPPAERIPLWPLGLPEPAPHGLTERNEGGVVGVVQPRIEVFHPPREADNGRVLLVMPGGGYHRLAVNNEGYASARYFAPRGFTVCVLIYRLPSEGWTARGQAPLQDAQRATRIIHARAADWGVDGGKIGLIGFSAGGHLAGMLATRFGQPSYAPRDGIDQQPTRPAYAGLIYPVITLSETSAHMVSRKNLVGDFPMPWQIAAYSVEKTVSADTPPVFLALAADDPIVPPVNGIVMFQAMQAAKGKAELHIFESGGHGFGLAAKTTAAVWPELFLRWAKAGGFIG